MDRYLGDIIIVIGYHPFKDEMLVDCKNKIHHSVRSEMSLIVWS